MKSLTELKINNTGKDSLKHLIVRNCANAWNTNV